MIQFLADTIDQLDLALDQLAVQDRNFDRFAMMLVDNVVELTLHKHAEDRFFENKMWGRLEKPKYDPKLVSNALGQNFNNKVKLARSLKLISNDISDSLLYLHNFRNTSYHKGLRHEGILHSLVLFYYENACELLKAYQPRFWAQTSSDVISHRAMKYLGGGNWLMKKDVFKNAWERLAEVTAAIPSDLVVDLSKDMSETISRTDHLIQFLSDDSPDINSRKEAVLTSQAWKFAFSDKGKAFARKNMKESKDIRSRDYVEWFVKNYKWPIPGDPIPQLDCEIEFVEEGKE